MRIRDHWAVAITTVLAAILAFVLLFLAVALISTFTGIALPPDVEMPLWIILSAIGAGLCGISVWRQLARGPTRTIYVVLASTTAAIASGLIATLLFTHSRSGVQDEAKMAEDPSYLPLFPWPPPEASTRLTIPRQFVTNSEASTLGTAETSLRRALLEAGYSDWSVYSVPEGFALVTRLEKINLDGTPSESDRWEITVPPLRIFSPSEYLRALFFGRPGYFRILVFTVTSQPFAMGSVVVKRDDAIGWVHRGANQLPPEIRDAAYTAEHTCTVLIYEFELNDNRSLLRLPGRLPAITHLRKSNIWPQLPAST